MSDVHDEVWDLLAEVASLKDEVDRLRQFVQTVAEAASFELPELREEARRLLHE